MLPNHPVKGDINGPFLFGMFVMSWNYLALLDLHVPEFSGLHDLEHHVSFPHVEELFSLLEVVVLALVGASNVENL